jgi:hypothetical protein
MATIGRAVTIKFNGAALEKYIAELPPLDIDEGPTFTIEIDPSVWTFGPFEVVRVRPAVRQSCLWRRSFDKRGRKRGHPLHRG